MRDRICNYSYENLMKGRAPQGFLFPSFLLLVITAEKKYRLHTKSRQSLEGCIKFKASSNITVQIIKAQNVGM